MAQLRELALKYQHALDGVTGATSSAEAEAAGVTLYRGTRTAMSLLHLAGRDDPHSILEPIVMRKMLVAIIAAYLERTSWGAVTPQMLSALVGKPLTACGPLPMQECAWMLRILCQASMYTSDSGGGILQALLLRQVCVSPFRMTLICRAQPR